MNTESTWLVSEGSYSDYRVLCACRTEADAEAIVERYNRHKTYNEAFVEEVPLLAPDFQTTTGYLRLECLVYPDGTASQTTESTDVVYPWDDDPHADGRDAKPNTYPCYPAYGQPKGVKAQSVGLDYEHTRKSFSDLRAQLMADPAYYDQQYRKLHGHGPNEQPPAQPKPSPFADWAVRNHPTSSLGSIIQVDGPWL